MADSTPQPPPKRQIVILGNGIGGSQISVKLLQYAMYYQKNYEITVIAANNYTEISMNMTRAVAEGPAQHEKCIYPMFQQFGIKYAIAVVTNLNEKEVTLDNGQVVPFDVCIVCTGQKHPIFAPSLEHRTMESRKMFIAAVHSSIKNAVNIVVAGGGGVGAEVAADIKLRFPATRLTVIHPMATILSAMSSEYAAIGTSTLKSMGVKMMLEQKVQSASEGTVKLLDGIEMPCDLLLKAFPQGANADFMPKRVSVSGGPVISTVDEKGYIKVNNYFQVDTFTNVFAFGDCCNYDKIKTYIRIEDQLPTVLYNVVALLEAGDMMEHNRGASFQAQIVGPAIVALGHGIEKGIGIGPDWPGIWGMLNWLCPMGGKMPCSPSFGPEIARLKTAMNMNYKPIPNVGIASEDRTK